MKVYAVQWCDDLDEWGACTLDRRCYQTRAEAEKRAEQIKLRADPYFPITTYITSMELMGADKKLNARAERTCEWTLKERWPNRTGDDHVYGYETSCGVRHTWWPDSLPKFCPTCGSKVKAVGA